jgi:hypothetical protein
MITGMTHIKEWDLSILSPWPIRPFFLLAHYIRQFASQFKALLMKTGLFHDDYFSGTTLSSNISLYEE